MKALVASAVAVFVAALPLAGAKAQKAETPYWSVTYRGAGQLMLQQNAEAQLDIAVDPVSSNVTHINYTTFPATNINLYGVSDNPPFIIWVLNGDAKGALLVKPNKRQRRVSAQHFSIICSNSNMQRIVVKLDRNSLFGDKLPLGAHTWNPVAQADMRAWVFADGDVGKMLFNCSLWGTMLYARSIGLLKFDDAQFSVLIAGTFDKMLPIVPTGSMTNDNVMVLKDGEITRLLARRIINTPIVVGAPLLHLYMDEAQAVFAQPQLRPTGTIGLLKAVEIGAYGERENQRWMLNSQNLPSKSGAVLADVAKLRVKRVCTEGTSVFIYE
jgi:hypothetical protein